MKDIMCGDECNSDDVRFLLDIKYPLDNGIVRNWDDMEKLWDYTFDTKLNVDTTESRILLTEPTMNPKKNREKMVETMFEKYRFKSCYVAVQAVLTLYAQGLLTGVVVDSGDGVTHVVPVYEGYSLPHLTRRLDVAGRDITSYLIKLLLIRGYAFNRSADFETVRRIKEKFCYVGYDLKAEARLATETTCLDETYTLPDGRVIHIGRERFEAPEALFRPDLLGLEVGGIHEMIFDCINSADMDTRPAFYQHIVLSGGTSMYPGLSSRLEKEIRRVYAEKLCKGNYAQANKLKLRIEDPPRRKHMVFLGGAVLAELMKDHDEFWFNRKDYEEQGLRILDAKSM